MFPKTGNEPVRKQRKSFSNTTLPAIHKRLISLGIDLPLLAVSLTLVIFGLLVVYSASTDFSLRIYGSPNYIFSRQLQVLLISLVGAVVLALLDYRFWIKLAVPAMLVTIGLLVVVLFISDERHGAVRTLWEGSIQPSELAKLVVIIYLSVWMFNKKEVLQDIQFGLIPLGLILGLIGGLIFIQPDISAVLTVFIIGGTMFFLAGGDIKQIAWMLIVAVFVGFLIVVISPTGNQRLGNFLPGLVDPLEAPYHVRRSLEAFYRGGWVGVGLGNADVKVTGLPVPHTDSVFAVIGEELGVIGCTFLVVLYLVILWRGLGIAKRAKDQLGSLLAAGLSFWILLEAIVNMLVMVNLLPFAGNALPFISAGGSNLMVSLAAIGLLLSISRQSDGKRDENERNVPSVVDLRRWDGGRRVPRTRHTSGIYKSSENP